MNPNPILPIAEDLVLRHQTVVRRWPGRRPLTLGARAVSARSEPRVDGSASRVREALDRLDGLRPETGRAPNPRHEPARSQPRRARSGAPCVGRGPAWIRLLCFAFHGSRIPAAVALALLPGLAGSAIAQSAAFTYQGRLNDNGGPATGSYEMRFVLRDALAGGSQVPGTPVPAGLIAVSNGHFTTTLDFGPSAFNGAPRWLEIAVRTNGSLLAHTPLAPRQPLTATPYATHAGVAANYTGSIGDSQLSGNVARLNAAQTFTGAVSFSPAGGPPFTVNTTNRVADLHADLLDGFSASAFWNLSGNSGSGPGHFLGTIDNQPLQLRVNNAPALRLEPNGTSPNVLGGHPGNHVAPGVAGAAIGGGGAAGATNTVTALHGTIAGGRAHRVGASHGTIGGGDSNLVAAAQATVAGGLNNQALGVLSVVSGGGTNTASGPGAVVAGGSQNLASGLRTAVGGGLNNTAAGNYSVVAGGRFNLANGTGAAVLGGVSNEATNSYATVLGGFDNTAIGAFSVAAGLTAQSLHDGSFVWSDSTGTAFASTAPNQFLIRATGGVGIGGAPQDAALDVEGDLRLNNYDLFLRAGVDRSHGVGWYGAGKTFAGLNVDGPVAYGWSGGALGTIGGGARAALQWAASRHVGIGRTPLVRLHVNDSAETVGLFEGSSPSGAWLSLENTAGGRRWSFISTGPGNGETAGQLLFFTAGSTKVTFRDSGHVGIGTTVPGERLELYGPDATLRLRNQNDAIGGFVGNTYGGVQFGLYNPSASAFNVVAAGAKRSFFGFDSTGKVGSMINNFFAPSFRNLLDDGNGNVLVSGGGALNFGSTTRQMLNLWNAEYGIGVQANTLYQRSANNFAWYRGGVHAENAYDSGNGSTPLMRLDSGGLTVSTTFISASDRDRKENFNGISPRDVLARLAAMPIHEWNYKDDAGVRHIGPTAQDFHAAFGVGPDDKHIAMVDADGVALAAIQGLHEELREKEARMTSLAKENEALQKRLGALEQAIAALAAEVRAGRR